jgi:hypothetical protein
VIKRSDSTDDIDADGDEASVSHRGGYTIDIDDVAISATPLPCDP